jgi:hypothetical protein
MKSPLLGRKIKIIKILIFISISIILITSLNILLFTQNDPSILKFDYNINKTKLEIDESLNLNIELTHVDNKPKAIYINKDILKDSAFRIIKIDYHSNQSKETPSSNKITYTINIKIGIRLNMISEYGIYEIPPIEINLISIDNPDDSEKYITAPQEIEVTRPFNFNFLLISIIIASIMGIFLLIYLSLKMINRKKQDNTKDRINIEELSETTYNRYQEKIKKYLQNKDKQGFLTSIENIIISYIYRKYNITSIDEFYQHTKSTDEEKIRVKNTLSNIEMLKFSKSERLSSEELEDLTVKVKIVLKTNKSDND